VAGRQWFYRDSGGAGLPVLLLIHGFPTASFDWHAVWAPLAAHFRLIAPDLLGFGFSDKPRAHAYSLIEQAQGCVALCQSLGAGTVHVLAHDYGVSVAQELLALHAEGAGLELQSVVFLNGGLFPESHRPRLIQHLLASRLGPLISRLNSQASFNASFSAVFGPNTQPSATELDEFWALIRIGDGHRLMHKLIAYMAERRAYRSRWVGALTATSVPLCLINGPEDPVSGAHLADRYQECVPNARVVRLPGIGHYPQVEAPAQVVRSFLEFHRHIGRP